VVGAGFNAVEDIGGLTAVGGVYGSVIVAGLGLGSDFAVAGAGGPLSAAMGVGGSGAAADVVGPGSNIALVTLSDGGTPGVFEGSTLSIGVTGPGLDAQFGTADDAAIGGSFVGPITASGGIVDAHVQGGSVNPIAVTAGTIEGSSIVASDPNGGIASVTVDHTSGVAGLSGAIVGSAFLSANTIGAVDAASSLGHGIFQTSFVANADGIGGGTLGSISGVSTAAGAYDGIGEAVGSGVMVGGIYGESQGTGDGIADSRFTGATGMGDITGIAAGGMGIGSTGFLPTLFRSGGGIGKIFAQSGSAFDGAIEGAGFNVKNGFATLTAVGPITGSVFVAGIDLGEDFAAPTGGPLSFAAIGYGGTGANADSAGTSGSIPGLTVGASPAGAYIVGSGFLAGVTGAGGDLQFGTADDVVLPGSTVGNLTVPGGIYTTLVEAGSIGNTTVTAGRITASRFVAASASGFIGNVNVSVALTGFETSAANNDAIGVSEFFSRGSIGSVTASVAGPRPDAGVVAAIGGSVFEAGLGIGPITATNASTTTGPGPYGVGRGISSSQFHAGMGGGSGVIGAVAATVASAGSWGDAAIYGGVFDAGAAGANLGNIAAAVADPTGQAIDGGYFRAPGSIGSVTATGTVANAVFTAGGDIGNISITGDSNGARYLAGIDLGTDFAWGGSGPAADAVYIERGIASLTVTGSFAFSDAAASMSILDGVLGDGDDFDAGGNGGYIGAISIGVGTVSTMTPSVFGISAYSLGSITIAGFQQFPFITVAYGGLGTQFNIEQLAGF
jgi:hypothetical protein